MPMLDSIRRVFDRRLVRDTAVLQLGGVLGTMVQAVLGVFLARILAPELYGQYALAFSVASIATLVLGSGAADAIAPSVSRAWTRGDGVGIRSAYGFFAKFMGAAAGLTVLVVLLLPSLTSHLYGASNIGRAAGIIVVASLISATVFTLVQLSLQVAGRMRSLATLTFLDVTSRYGLSLALAVVWGLYGAVGGHLVGATVVVAVAVVVYNRLAQSGDLLPRLSDLPPLARVTPWRPLIGPTLWVMADRNLAMLYGALPVAMIGLYVTGAEVAYFKLAFGYIVLAMSVLGPISTVLNVHFPTVQESRGKLAASFVEVTLYSVLMSFCITAVVLAISPMVFKILYGQEYLPAIPYVYGFGVFGALFGLGVGLGPMWRAIDKVRISIIINLIMLGTGVPLGAWLIMRRGVWGAVAMVTVWYTVSHGVSFWYLLRHLKKRDGKLYT